MPTLLTEAKSLSVIAEAVKEHWCTVIYIELCEISSLRALQLYLLADAGQFSVTFPAA